MEAAADGSVLFHLLSTAVGPVPVCSKEEHCVLELHTPTLCLQRSFSYWSIDDMVKSLNHLALKRVCVSVWVGRRGGGGGI